jgi:hypothetical protein
MRQGTEVKITFPAKRVMQPTPALASHSPKAISVMKEPIVLQASAG